MVSNMSAINLRSSLSNSVTGSPGFCNTGSGYFTIGKIISLFLVAPYLFDVAFKISFHLERRVPAKLLRNPIIVGTTMDSAASTTGTTQMSLLS